MMNKKIIKGFTLAEVLITLVVLGIIAAITVPTLRNSLDEKRYRVPLKKAYSVLSEALDQTVKTDKHLNVKSGGYSRYNFNRFAVNLRKHLNIEKICCQDGSNNIFLNASGKGCTYGIQYIFADDKCFSSNSRTSKTSTDGIWPISSLYSGNSVAFVLKDGTSVFMRTAYASHMKDLGLDAVLRGASSNIVGTCTCGSEKEYDITESECSASGTGCTWKKDDEASEEASSALQLIVDVNGLNGPNIRNIDIHAFAYTPSDGLIPAGINELNDGSTSIWTTYDFMNKE